MAAVANGGVMGIGCDTIEILIRLKQDGYLEGPNSVVEIGTQQLANNFLDARDALERLGRLFGIDVPCRLPPPIPAHLVHGSLEHLDASAPPSRTFWRWLGFDYASIDIDGNPGSIPLDLNYDGTPDGYLGRYQVVTNFGTTEHIANQLNAFQVIHELTANGGLMIHQLPMQGMINHGLVNYNPKFFWMLGRSNGYKLVDADVSFADSDYELPQNIVDLLSTFRPDIRTRRQRYRVADSMVLTIFQKVFDSPYVAPLDVPTGTKTDNRALQERYWSVFKPNAFG
jgi:hypothetical protein